jgi:hypothetical protein
LGGELRQRLHVGADGDDEIVHLLPRGVGRGVDRFVDALEKFL